MMGGCKLTVVRDLCFGWTLNTQNWLPTNPPTRQATATWWMGSFGWQVRGRKGRMPTVETPKENKALLLMATRNPVSSPVEVGSEYPIIYDGFARTIPGGGDRRISEPSTVLKGFMKPIIDSWRIP